MNKMHVLAIVAIVIILISVGAVILIPKAEKELDGYDIAAQGLDIEFDADIMVYGENPNFRDTVKWRKIDGITEETLNYEEPHGYRAVILFDHGGTMTITDEELLLIKSYVEEKGYDMIYIGKDYLPDLSRLGFTRGYESDEYSLGYIGSMHVGKEIQQNSSSNLYAMHGIWMDSDEEVRVYNEELLQWVIITDMYDFAREAAGIEF